MSANFAKTKPATTQGTLQANILQTLKNTFGIQIHTLGRQFG